MPEIDFITLYKIKNYKSVKNDFITLSYENLITKEKEMNKLLKENHGFHDKYDEKYDCIAYGDIDKCETLEKLYEILGFIYDMYYDIFKNQDSEIKIKMKYTLSNPKPNSYGTHWTIPKIKTNIPTLKIRMEKLGEKININGVEYVDPSVYNKTG